MSRGNFRSIHTHGMVRVATCTPRVCIGDPECNASETISLVRRGDAEHVDLMVFPELGLSAYALDDLLLQDALLEQVESSIEAILVASRTLRPVLVMGAPIRRNGRLYNCAIVISRGRLLGIVPKSFLPNYREYYEKRWFAPGAGVTGLTATVAGQLAPFGTDLIFQSNQLSDFIFLSSCARTSGRRHRPPRTAHLPAR